MFVASWLRSKKARTRRRPVRPGGSGFRPRLETLQDRLQPNDLLGLGASLLDGWSPMDFGKSPETPQLVHPVDSSASRPPAEIDEREARPFEFQTHAQIEQPRLQAIAVSDKVMDQVFAAANAENTAFEDNPSTQLSLNARLQADVALIISDSENFPNYVSSYDFGNVPLGTAVTHEFTLTNYGTTNATRLVLLLPRRPFDGSAGNCGRTLAPLATCTWSATLNPTHVRHLGPLWGIYTWINSPHQFYVDLLVEGTVV